MLALSGTLALSGCTKNSDTSGPTTATTAAKAAKVDEIAATLPEDIKSSGKLIVGVNVPYTPNEFKDPSGKIFGFDVDLMNAIAAEAKLDLEFKSVSWDGIFAGVQNGT